MFRKTKYSWADGWDHLNGRIQNMYILIKLIPEDSLEIVGFT